MRESITLNGLTVRAAVDVAAQEIILLASDVADAGETGRITIGDKELGCRPWRTAGGIDYVIVTLGKDPPPIDGLVE